MTQRVKDHLQKARNKVGGQFQKAIETYGPEAFEWTEIDTAGNANEMAEKEKQYIVQFKAQEEGYNPDRGGDIKGFLSASLRNWRHLVNFFFSFRSS